MTTKGQVLDFESIPNSSVKHVAQLLDQVGGQAFVYVLSSQTSADGAASRIEVVHYIGSDKVPMTDFNGMRVQLGLPQSSADVTVAMLVVASQTNRLNSLVDLLTNVPGISLTRSGTAYIEVRPMNSTKALGLARVLSALSVDRQNVMAIGDNDNDVEMLEFCGLAVSVANASPKAKAVSQYVTERSAADGVVEVLDLLKRVKRLSN
jgi:hydroxymethylpyrimidine pyrophosphatase-like HAD family hydrolase